MSTCCQRLSGSKVRRFPYFIVGEEKSHPVTTYRVIDLCENLGEGKQLIRAKMPHMRLDVDVDLMTAREQRQAAAMLLEAAKRLSKIGAKA